MPSVRLEPKGSVIDVPKGARLIDVIRDAGLPIARACGDELICAKCGVRILAGTVRRESRIETRTKRRNRVSAGLRLACALRVQDDLVVTADYWGNEARAMRRALVLVDHGSRRPEAHQRIEELAARIRERAGELRVHVGHMDLAEPSLGDAIAAAVAEGAQEVIVHPLFLVPGQHLREDIPALVERAREGHAGVEIRVTEALGSLPGLADLILTTL